MSATNAFKGSNGLIQTWYETPRSSGIPPSMMPLTQHSQRVDGSLYFICSLSVQRHVRASFGPITSSAITLGGRKFLRSPLRRFHASAGDRRRLRTLICPAWIALKIACWMTCGSSLTDSTGTHAAALAFQYSGSIKPCCSHPSILCSVRLLSREYARSMMARKSKKSMNGILIRLEIPGRVGSRALAIARSCSSCFSIP